MKQFLINIGWKDPYGDWNKDEIIIDLGVIFAVAVVAFCSYIMWSMYNA